MLDLKTAIARFGADAKAKLSNPSATGEPEDQLRAPLEALFADLAELCGFQRQWVAAVGESSLSTLKVRPDYAITLRKVLVGFVEVKAPGKGADPRRYKGHDKDQWEKLQSVPNLLYTDGNFFSLWQNGELVGSIVELKGDVETAGAKLATPLELFPDRGLRRDIGGNTCIKDFRRIRSGLSVGRSCDNINLHGEEESA